MGSTVVAAQLNNNRSPKQGVQYPTIILLIYVFIWQVSGVKISNVTYQDVEGTSATKVAVKFECSESSPCHAIKLENINLSYKNQAARATCSNAAGTVAGIVEPSSCLFWERDIYKDMLI